MKILIKFKIIIIKLFWINHVVILVFIKKFKKKVHLWFLKKHQKFRILIILVKILINLYMIVVLS
jgi:hypothetical protein